MPRLCVCTCVCVAVCAFVCTECDVVERVGGGGGKEWVEVAEVRHE